MREGEIVVGALCVRNMEYSSNFCINRCNTEDVFVKVFGP